MRLKDFITIYSRQLLRLGFVTTMLLLTTITASAQSLTTNIAVGKAPVAVAVNPTTNTIFAVNAGENTVSIINGANNTTRKVGTSPQCTAITLDAVRNKAYVMCPSTQAVIIVDGNSNAVSGTGLAIPGTPSALAFNPVTNKLYVTTSANNATFNEVDVINGADPFNIPIVHIPVGSGPSGIAVNQITNTIYVSNAFDHSISVIDGTTNTVNTIPLTKTHDPGSIAVNPVTNKIYVLDESGVTDLMVLDGATNAISFITTPGLGNQLAVNPVTNKIYVTDVNNQSVDVIDGTNDTLKTSIPMLNPDSVAIDVVTDRVYVDSVDAFTAPFGDVLVFDGTTDTFIKKLPTGNITSTFNQPLVAVNPITNKVYVADNGTNDIAVVDEASNITTNVTTESAPSGVAANPITGMFYVTAGGSGFVQAIDTLHNNQVTSIKVGGLPQSITVCIPTNEIYVANGNNINVISGSTNTLVATIPITSFAAFIQANNATDTVYVSSTINGTVTAINALNHTVAGTVNIGGSLGNFDINSVTDKVYVTNQTGNTVAVIDGVTNTVVHTVTVGGNPTSLAVNPVTNRVYVANSATNNVSIIDGSTDTKTTDVNLGVSPSAIALNQFTNKIYIASLTGNVVAIIDGTNNNKSTIAIGGANRVSVNPTTNKIYTSNVFNDNVTMLDGATNFANTFATAARPTNMAVNPVTNQIAIGSSTTNNVTILSEQQVQSIPLTTAITPLLGDVHATGVFEDLLSASSSYSPIAPPPQNVFFQLDTWQGTWTKTTPDANLFLLSINQPLSPGTHILFAYATDGQEGQGIDQSSNGIGQIVAYLFTVQPGLTKTGVGISVLPPSVFGQTVTFTPFVESLNDGATGTVSLFRDGNILIGTAPLVNTTAVFPVSNLSVGTHTIFATFNPNNGAFLTSTSEPFDFTVNQAQVRTTLTSNVNPSVFGQSVTFSTTVSALPPGAGTPTGTVTFADGSTPLGTVTLDNTGKASFSTASLSAGNHLISVSYNGDTNFAALQAGTSFTQVVNQAAVQTTLASSLNPSIFSQNVTFTATVSAKAPGAGTPTGTVTFLDGGTAIGTGTLSAGKATFSTNSLSVGTHTITINYGGDTNFLSLTAGSTVTQTVNKAPTTTTVATSVTPSVFGQQVTFTATVVSAAPAAMAPSLVIGRSVRPRGSVVVSRTRAAVPLAATPIPTGTVTFFDGAAQIGTGTLNASGQATFTTGALSVGTHTITAVYGGDGNYLGSTSGPITQVVNKANTNTVVTSSAALAFVGGTVTYTATIVPVAPGAGVPTGFVQFRDNGINIGAPVALSGAKASVVEGNLTPGNHVITAIYTGDGNFNPSNGALPGGQMVGFQFIDSVSGNTLIVVPPANGQSGNGSYTWLNNGTPVVSNVPALIQFNTQTLRIQTTSPAMFALFDASSHVGQATLFVATQNKSFNINISSFVLQ